MTIGLTREQALQFRALPRWKQEEIIAGMSDGQLLAMDAAFEMWANEGQLPPPSEGWLTWLMMAGRGFGKTRAGAEWILALGQQRPVRIALVAASLDEARSVMVEGASGLLTLSQRRGLKLKFEPSKRQVVWPGGSIATLYSGESPELLRGPEHHFAWCDELAKWARADECWTNLQMGLRLGMRPRALVTTTPKTMPLIERLRADPDTVETGGRTGDNVTLSRRFVDAMVRTYGGTRTGRQELDGEYLGETEGSLFPRALLEQARVIGPPATFDRVVVAVDPPVSTDGDACGIVVAGRANGIIHVLADLSVPACRPERWAGVAARAARDWGASHVVAEANQGGAMVRSVLEAADPELSVRLVHASSGKSARAEPVALRMETGRVRLAGLFPELEAELCGLQIGGGYDGPGRSPDRADAMVWAVTELSETRSGVPRVRAL